jgi:hypothetical protein
MKDEQILKSLGLTEEEFRKFLQAQKTFFDSMSDDQRKLIIESQPTTDQAAGMLSKDLTGQELGDFLTSRALEVPALVAGWMVTKKV